MGPGGNEETFAMDVSLKEDRNHKKSGGVGLAVVLIAVLLSFLLVFHFFYPVPYDNLGGEHSWLSGSTLKFVNEWLREGAATNRFTCYESFDSIEFSGVSERTVFSVYAAAKLMGKSQIDISFLKHFQMVCFCIETLAFAAFVYLFIRGQRRFGKVFQILIPITLAIAWMLLPENVYYLCNVFYADQFVILWVMLFLLLEYISHMHTRHEHAYVGSIPKAGKICANVLKCFVIYMGVMTDYYFWILVFVAFVLRFLRNLLVKKSILKNLREMLLYICPVLLAVGTFFWQLIYTANWQEELLGKFFFRTGGLEEGNVFVKILINFYGAFADASKVKLAALLLVCGGTAILVICHLIKKKKFKQLFTRSRDSILVLGFAAPLIQIFFLKNHSAIHEFSMLKMGWPVMMAVPVLAVLIADLRKERTFSLFGKKVSHAAVSYILIFAVMAVITGIPLSADYYVNYRYAERHYPLEEILSETMEYENVCFSYTYEIPINPPHSLAVSKKQVYRIESPEEMDSYFLDLPDEAVKVLVIDKTNPDKSERILEMENISREQNPVIYEDNSYCLLWLSHS